MKTGLILAILISAIIIILGLNSNKQNELRIRKEEEERRAEMQRKHRDSLLQSMERDRDHAIEVYSRIPKALLTAEELLDRAEKEFEDSAFSPFWEAVEDVLIKLASVDDEVQKIGTLATSYSQTALQYEGDIEKFPVDLQAVKRLAAADKTHLHMHSIIRLAQKNFQFATIFEQRRTTHVLIAGFSTLGEAIDGLGQRLSSSLETLSDQVRYLEQGQRIRHSEVVSSLQGIAGETREAAKAAAGQRDRAAAAQSTAAGKQLDMLDNIQRGRKPHADERGSRLPY